MIPVVRALLASKYYFANDSFYVLNDSRLLHFKLRSINDVKILIGSPSSIQYRTGVVHILNSMFGFAHN